MRTGTRPPAGAAVPMVLAPYRLEQVAVGQHIVAWGQQRGARLVAEVVMIEDAPAAP